MLILKDALCHIFAVQSHNSWMHCHSPSIYCHRIKTKTETKEQAERLLLMMTSLEPEVIINNKPVCTFSQENNLMIPEL